MDAYVREDEFYSEKEREKDELLLRRLEQEDYSFRVGIGNLSQKVSQVRECKKALQRDRE